MAVTTVKATRVSRDVLRKLPTSAKPVIDASDVAVPEGYDVEPVMVGLSFPTAMGFADDGTLFVCEGAAHGRLAPIWSRESCTSIRRAAERKSSQLAFQVVNEKTEQQLILQEYLLEMGPVSILYKDHV